MQRHGITGANSAGSQSVRHPERGIAQFGIGQGEITVAQCDAVGEGAGRPLEDRVDTHLRIVEVMWHGLRPDGVHRFSLRRSRSVVLSTFPVAESGIVLTTCTAWTRW